MDNDQERQLPVSSSHCPVFCLEQESLFREVMGLMIRNKVQFAVSGAFALHQHTGIWRDTKDLDLFLPAREAVRALGLLAQNGFETEVLDPVWLAKARRGDYYVDLITGMSNAVVRVDDSWIQRAAIADVFGIQTPVLAPEELIASKVFVTRRERFDGADICHIIHGARGRLDWRRLMHLMGEHWEMLLWSLVLFHYVYPASLDYVPREIWEELLQRFKVELRRPNRGTQFRGSLIDERMFAIDVLEWGQRNIMEEYRQRAETMERATGEGIAPENPYHEAA